MAAAGTRLSPSQVETVVAAASTGAAWAFEALYRDFAPAVVGYLRLQGASDPDDLSSEVFLGAFRGITQFRGGHAEFKTWLFSIAHRRLIDDRRRRSRQESRMARAELAVETCTDA
ncbi:MAG TPA: sigma factor, partial [Acidimicrobiales bacterium]|nr:sigma factor [Acidimicrobiales bacterium]